MGIAATLHPATRVPLSNPVAEEGRDPEEAQMLRHQTARLAYGLRHTWKTKSSELWVLPAEYTTAGAAAAPSAIQKLSVAAKFVFGVGATFWATQQEDLSERAKLAWLAGVRLTRDVVTAASIVAGAYY